MRSESVTREEKATLPCFKYRLFLILRLCEAYSAHAGDKNAFIILVGKLEENTPLEETMA
jgi:hypothetical protein